MLCVVTFCDAGLVTFSHGLRLGHAAVYPADYDPTSNVTHPLLNIRDEEVCEDTFHGKLKGLGCNKIPDVFFFSCLLFTFTFVLSYWLKMFRNQRFFPAKVSSRQHRCPKASTAF